uniref:Uncharacterized protein n=2 Tax=Amorphochlora amoebiformis TaxID=1561963 RepID=A0A7S0GSU5_9EUKA|mmetsp:Transcript_16271/g.25787  ORF Transcript_16271/g.25787 Transcript_16271/m.25787 type:complete len:260 (+) Transcript_16271:216-995(+)
MTKFKTYTSYISILLLNVSENDYKYNFCINQIQTKKAFKYKGILINYHVNKFFNQNLLITSSLPIIVGSMIDLMNLKVLSNFFKYVPIDIIFIISKKCMDFKSSSENGIYHYIKEYLGEIFTANNSISLLSYYRKVNFNSSVRDVLLNNLISREDSVYSSSKILMYNLKQLRNPEIFYYCISEYIINREKSHDIEMKNRTTLYNMILREDQKKDMFSYITFLLSIMWADIFSEIKFFNAINSNYNLLNKIKAVYNLKQK